MYKTEYSLSIVNDPYRPYINQYINHLAHFHPEAFNIFHPDGMSKGFTIWEQHEICMDQFSRQHPKVIFMLSAVGENTIDLWAKYFLNGQHYRTNGRISFEHFNEQLLK